MRRDGDFEVITLRNGARAVRHLGHGEVMHPSVGPWREANRLYVEQTRMAELLAGETPAQPLRVLDVGLGAGANAAAALSCAAGLATPRRALELVSFEVDLAPLRLALADPEGFPYLERWRRPAEVLMREGRYSEGGLEWSLQLGDVLDGLPRAPGSADLVFFDPFSPEKNPALWTRAALSKIRGACGENGQGALLVTYSASTRTRASLLLAGFFAGAGVSIGTKKETTLAATRLVRLEHPLAAPWLRRWERSSARAPHGEELTSDLEAAIRAHPQFSAGEQPAG